MSRRGKQTGDSGFDNLAFLDILANSIGALAFIFLMFFVIIAGLIKPSKFRVLTDSLPDGRAESNYKVSLAAAGGVEPYRWKVLSGALPGTMRLGDGDGIIEGKPGKEGTYKFVIEVKDGGRESVAVVRRSLVLRVRASSRISSGEMPLEIATQHLPRANAYGPYEVTLAATGGRGPYLWTLDDPLPPGVILDGDTLIGNPKTSGDWPIKIKAVDEDGELSEKRFVLTVAPKTVMTEDGLEELRIYTVGLPHAILHKNYEIALAAGGGVPPYGWSIERGELPRGLRLDHATGKISGRPKEAKTKTFTVATIDGRETANAAKRQLTLTVDPIQYQTQTSNPLLNWWVMALGTILAIIGVIVVTAVIIGVQCPWDKSWRCKPIGKDENGRTIYECKHGHKFVNEPRLLSLDRHRPQR